MTSEASIAAITQVFDPFAPDCFTVGRAPDGGLLIAKRFGDLSEISLCVPPIYLQRFFDLVGEVVLRARDEGLMSPPEAHHGH